jgi:hypothetical protein
MVEQWHPAFERDGHAHLVGEQQQVVRQLRFGIDGEHPVQFILVAGHRESPLQRIGRPPSPARSAGGDGPPIEDLQVAAIPFVSRHLG